MKLVCVFLIIVISSLSAVEIGPKWKIDRKMGFSFGYLPEQYDVSGKYVERVYSREFTSSFTPDITNINLNDLLKLGFPFKQDKDGNSKVFIKLYEFPKCFVAENSSLPVVSDFLLDKTELGTEIEYFVTEHRNLGVKLCLVADSARKFSITEPFPEFRVPVKPPFQDRFNSHCLFYSLYVKPRMDMRNFKLAKAAALWSSQGLKEFHENFIASLRENLRERPGIDPDFLYFLDSRDAYKIKGVNRITVIRVPKKVERFKNWKDLPMPHDPEGIFLSGLFLIYRHTYYTRVRENLVRSIPDVIGSDEFSRVFLEHDRRIMEIGSVFHMKDYLWK